MHLKRILMTYPLSLTFQIRSRHRRPSYLSWSGSCSSRGHRRPTKLCCWCNGLGCHWSAKILSGEAHGTHGSPILWGTYSLKVSRPLVRKVPPPRRAVFLSKLVSLQWQEIKERGEQMLIRHTRVNDNWTLHALRTHRKSRHSQVPCTTPDQKQTSMKGVRSNQER